MGAKEKNQAIDDITTTFGPVAGLCAALFTLAFEVTKLYVVIHFVVKFW